MKMPVLAALASAAIALATPAVSCDGYDVQLLQLGGETYDPSHLTGQLVRLVVEAPQIDQKCAGLNAVIRPRDGVGSISLKRLTDVLDSRPVGSPAVVRAHASEIVISPAARQALARDGRVMLDLLQIDTGQFMPVGDYVAELEWVAEGRDPQPLEIKVRVEPSVRFVGDNVRRLSLGEVSDGGEASSRFFYATNANLRITARSLNGGRLQHELGSTFGAIPYDAFLSGSRLDLTTPMVVNLPFQRAHLGSEELRVQVRPQEGRYAGTYRDVLSLDFVAY